MACVRMRQLQSQYFLYLAIIGLLSLPKGMTDSTTSSMSLPGCPDKCGSITIPYPFGTSHKCSRNDEFLITCNTSTSPPKAFAGTASSNIELIDIQLNSGEARVYKYIGFRCFNQSDQIYFNNSLASMDLSGLPFHFSNRRNIFTVIGCDAYAVFMDTPYLSGCVSVCDSLSSTTGDGGSCNGSGCCQTPIPETLDYYELLWVGDNNSAWSFNPCAYAVLVEEDWYHFEVQDLINTDFYDKNEQGVPVVLDWAIRDNGTCENGLERSPNRACLSKNSICNNTINGQGYLCSCSPGYQGNPYLPDGCSDIDECKFPDKYPCHGICSNIEGDYQCSCQKGSVGNAKTGNCTKHENFPYPARVAIFSIVGIAIFIGSCFLIATHLQHKRHIKEKEEYKRYQEMMNNYLRVFSIKQIEIATNNYDETQILGTGGHGKVYKGYLEDNMPVAIKRAKEVEENQREEFVNEILLLSQINHKNIVRLIGCCMEVKVPMLIYEYVSNGTLQDMLHGKSRTRQISLVTRLNIALELAEALEYLHSSISRSILHGDVKSANILLDENYCVKVSDFGASNLVPVDDTQVVKVVQGTRGYIDPEYVATGVLTKKSDVYSFGVVLLELITRKPPIFRDEILEIKHLGSCFVSNANKNKPHDLLDKDIVSTDDKVVKVLLDVSELAVWCLSITGEDRPTMRQVVDKLQHVVRLHNSLLGSATINNETESLISESKSYTISDVAAFHSTSSSSVLEIETRWPR